MKTIIAVLILLAFLAILYAAMSYFLDDEDYEQPWPQFDE